MIDSTAVEVVLMVDAINNAATSIGWSIFLGMLVLSITVYLTEVVLV